MSKCYECETELTVTCPKCNSTLVRCDELKTIFWGNSVALSRPHDPEVWNRTVASCPRPFYTVELVTRQNAEAVIAEKEERIEDLENNSSLLSTLVKEGFNRGEALEKENKRLREALIKISRGSYDGLEVTSLSAKQMKNIANAVLAEVKP